MKTEEVARSTGQIDRRQFQVLTNLMQKQAWIARRAPALFDTITLCEEDAERDLLVSLLTRFHYASEESLKEKIEVIARTISEDWKCTPNASVIASINNGEFSDSSDMMAYRLKGALTEFEDWRTHNFLKGLSSAVEKVPDEGFIILVDDFSGSGTSISGKVDWLRDKLEEVGKTADIFVAIATAMTQAKDVIEPKATRLFIAELLHRGISDYFVDADLTNAKEAMVRLESELCSRFGRKKLSDYSFGYKETEALYYAESLNPPNNNFPIFWWPLLKGKRKRETILRRI